MTVAMSSGRWESRPGVSATAQPVVLTSACELGPERRFGVGDEGDLDAERPVGVGRGPHGDPPLGVLGGVAGDDPAGRERARPARGLPTRRETSHPPIVATHRFKRGAEERGAVRGLGFDGERRRRDGVAERRVGPRPRFRVGRVGAGRRGPLGEEQGAGLAGVDGAQAVLAPAAEQAGGLGAGGGRHDHERVGAGALRGDEPLVDAGLLDVPQLIDDGQVDGEAVAGVGGRGHDVQLAAAVGA